MPLHPYADRPLRAALQVSADLLVAAWVILWGWVAVQIHHAVTALAGAGYRLRDAGVDVAGELRDAGDVARRVPLAGDLLAAPLGSAGGAAGGLADAGRQLGDGIASSALPLALIVVLATTLPILTLWGMLRLHYARRAGATARLARSPTGPRLLALRALATAPARKLEALPGDPVTAWMEADEDAVRILAALELDRAGLHGSRLTP